MSLRARLYGEKIILPQGNPPKSRIIEDGFEVVSMQLKLGYWINHPDLHGYIIDKFSDNIFHESEGYQSIVKVYLSADEMSDILWTIEEDMLPDCYDMFISSSSEPMQSDLQKERSRSMDIFTQAIQWKAKMGFGTTVLHRVIYEAEILNVPILREIKVEQINE